MSEFKTRLLYSQKTAAVINEEEPVTVSSTIYAVKFLYPGASQSTTGRIRITCTYRDTDQFEAHAGVIERWTDKGWILMDDYTDEVLAFHSEDEFRKRLLDYSHAFILGIPLFMVDKDYTPELTSTLTSRNSTPKKMFDNELKENKKAKETKQKKDSYNKNQSKDSDADDDDDIDWL